MTTLKSLILLLMMSCVSAGNLPDTGYSVAQEVTLGITAIVELPRVEPEDTGLAQVPVPPNVLHYHWQQTSALFVARKSQYSPHSPRAPPPPQSTV